jgi:hypothetical protein
MAMAKTMLKAKDLPGMF